MLGFELGMYCVWWWLAIVCEPTSVIENTYLLHAKQICQVFGWLLGTVLTHVRLEHELGEAGATVDTTSAGIPRQHTVHKQFIRTIGVALACSV